MYKYTLVKEVESKVNPIMQKMYQQTYIPQPQQQTSMPPSMEQTDEPSIEEVD